MATPSKPASSADASTQLALKWGGHAMPATPTPTPPAGYVPPTHYEMLGSHPRQAEVATAAAVVAELRGFTDYEKLFGSTVPPVEAMAAVLDLARQWRTERDAAAAWNEYVRGEDAVSWKVALELLDELKPAFQLAALKRPDIATTYPRLAAFFDSRRQIAQRAVATKKSKAKQAAAEPEPTPPKPDASS